MDDKPLFTHNLHLINAVCVKMYMNTEIVT